MAKKDLIVKVTVDNSGCGFEDDVSLVLLTVPAEITIDEVNNKISEINKKFHKESPLDTECCYYAEHGWNSNVLLEEVYVETGWSYEYLTSDLEFTI